MEDREMEVPNFPEPKKVPFKCPVCNGFGTLKYGAIICQACAGKGYVIVDQEIDGGKDDSEFRTSGSQGL